MLVLCSAGASWAQVMPAGGCICHTMPCLPGVNCDMQQPDRFGTSCMCCKNSLTTSPVADSELRTTTHGPAGKGGQGGPWQQAGSMPAGLTLSL